MPVPGFLFSLLIFNSDPSPHPAGTGAWLSQDLNFPIWAIPHAAMLTTPHKLKINTKRPKTIR